MPTLPMSCNGADLDQQVDVRSVRVARTAGASEPRGEHADVLLRAAEVVAGFEVARLGQSRQRVDADVLDEVVLGRRRTISASRKAFWSCRTSRARLSSRWVRTRASTIAGCIGLVM